MAERRRRYRKNNAPILITIAVLALILAGLIAFAFTLGSHGDQLPDNSMQSSQDTPDSSSDNTPEPEPEPEPPITKVSTATFSAVGDMLMHIPVINTGYDSSTGSYDFEGVFRYFADYIQAADYAAGNLETTLAGTDNGYKYSGYPQFNCPDGIIDSMKAAGFDMVLTANNHSYDTRTIGLNRTLQIIRDRQLASLGTKLDAGEPNYVVAQCNGIKIALSCYTYETDGYADKKALNGISMSAADQSLINSFDYKHLDLFYNEITESMAQMEEDSVDAFILFIHWGNEYQTTQNATQSAIAQALCDLGVDVIVGGHPHVVQPVELLTSTKDETQKTVCLYSMGNAVSNQRRQNMNLKTGHTEDGVMFSVTFALYSDGTVILESAEILPTWVNLCVNPVSGRQEYNILPLDTQIEDWKTQFHLTDATFTKAQQSYDRTIAIVGDGITEVNTYLQSHVAQVEELLGVE